MEKQNKLGQEPAFPCEVISDEDGIRCKQVGPNSIIDFGISKRLYLAGMAMQGLLANSDSDVVKLTPSQLALIAYDYTDELLSQEND